jgi:hypothetical protein
MEELRRVSEDGKVDLIVGTHRPHASLVRLHNGVSLEIEDICALGYDEPFRDLIDEARTPESGTALRHSKLRHRFSERLMTNKVTLPHVGGFPIVVDATPQGHRYLGFEGAYTNKFPDLKWGDEAHQPIDQVYSGESDFKIAVVPSNVADVPVVGAYLVEARTGFIYSPMEFPEVFSIPLAPPDFDWPGDEQQLYDVLNREIASHVSAVGEIARTNKPR